MSTPALPLTSEQALRQRCRRLLADQRRRARADGVELRYDVEDLLHLARQAKTCHYCNAPLSLELSMDHRTAISRGGRHAIDNLAVCCRRCQSLKGRLNADEFAALLAFLAQLYPAATQDIQRRLLAGASVYADGRPWSSRRR